MWCRPWAPSQFAKAARQYAYSFRLSRLVVIDDTRASLLDGAVVSGAALSIPFLIDSLTRPLYSHTNESPLGYFAGTEGCGTVIATRM